MKFCTFCGHKYLKSEKVQYIYRTGDQFLIVNHVPCLVCSFCGEQYFHSRILKSIEKDFVAIQSHRKKVKKTLRIPVQEFSVR